MSGQSWTYLFVILSSGIALAILYWEWCRRRGCPLQWQKRVGSLLFILYFVWVATTLWVPFKIGSLNPSPTSEAQAFPLLFILNMVADAADRLAEGQTIWNTLQQPILRTTFILFLTSLPVGLYLASTGKLRRARDAWRASLAFWLLLEIWRASGIWGLLPPTTGFDIDNILIGSLAGIVGYYLYPTARHWLYTPQQARPDTVTGWRRAAALALDVTVVYLVSRILHDLSPAQPIPWTEIVAAIYFVLTPALFNGATLAKAAVFLRLTTAKGEAPTVGRLWWRYTILLGPYLAIYRLLYLPALIKESRVLLGVALLSYLVWTGYYLAMVALDPEHRSLHERLSGVVNRNAWTHRRKHSATSRRKAPAASSRSD